MVIYGEILFLENALTGGLLLWMTKGLCGLKLSVKKLLIGAFSCGIYAFTLFQGEIPFTVSLLQKLIFSMALIGFTFGRQRFYLAWIVFYVISFLMGGVTVGLAGLFSIPAVSANGSFYLEQMSYIHIICGCGATILITYLFLDLIKDQRHRLTTKREVTIIHRGKTVRTTGFWDTGNRLMDPVTGYPVCLISSELWNELSYGGEDLRILSYVGAAGEESALFVCLAEELRIKEGGVEKRFPAVLGIGADGKGMQSWGGCQMLLNGLCMVETLGEIRNQKEGESHKNVG